MAPTIRKAPPKSARTKLDPAQAPISEGTQRVAAAVWDGASQGDGALLSGSISI